MDNFLENTFLFKTSRFFLCFCYYSYSLWHSWDSVSFMEFSVHVTRFPARISDFQNNLNKASDFWKAEKSQKVGTATEQIFLAACF